MGRNLYHAVRAERGISQFARLFWRCRRRRLIGGALARAKSDSEPARKPALMFGVFVIAIALVDPLAFSPTARGSESSPSSSSQRLESSEEACAAIRSALNNLASAERAQAFALDLGSPPGSSTTLIEARLAEVLNRTSSLRDVLRQVRANAVQHDARVEQCTRMGFHALVEAEKLTTNVEELLRNREADASATAGAVRSDAAPAGRAAQP